MVTILEEWISIEFDHLIGNASNADPITDCLCDKQYDLIGKANVSDEANSYPVHLPWSARCTSEHPVEEINFGCAYPKQYGL